MRINSRVVVTISVELKGLCEQFTVGKLTAKLRLEKALYVPLSGGLSMMTSPSRSKTLLV